MLSEESQSQAQGGRGGDSTCTFSSGEPMAKWEGQHLKHKQERQKLKFHMATIQPETWCHLLQLAHAARRNDAREVSHTGQDRELLLDT